MDIKEAIVMCVGALMVVTSVWIVASCERYKYDRQLEWGQRPSMRPNVGGQRVETKPVDPVQDAESDD